MEVQPKHDFTAKLRQESVLPTVQAYAAWQRSVREGRVAGIAPAPLSPDFGLLSINLDLTTACNYACTHCIDWDMLNSRAKYEHEKLMDSLKAMMERGLRSVILIGGGEPTLYPKFGDVVRLLKSGGVGVAVVSNGSRNHVIEEVADAFTEGDWVRYSLDSGTDATFQDMHKPKRPITLEEICAGVPAIKAKSPVLTVGFSYIIVWKGAEREEGIDIIPNIDEIVTATRLARDSGFNYISFKPFLTRHLEGSEVMDPEVIENFNDTIRRITQGVAEAKTFEASSFKVMESTNLRVLLAGTWRDYTNQPKMCHMMAMRQVVSPLGVYNCPAHRGLSKARLANRDGFATGDLRQETNTTLAGMLDSFDASHECSSVTCLYNSANWWLERMVEGTLTPEEQTALPDRGDYFL